MKSVQGIYRDGRIELDELPGDVRDEARVIVTFLGSGGVDLRQRGISEAEAEALRGTLATFVDEWESPEMQEYDDYDAAKRRTS